MNYQKYFHELTLSFDCIVIGSIADGGTNISFCSANFDAYVASF